MKLYVFDEKILLKLQGLRFVVREDFFYTEDVKNRYRLRWNYKEAEGFMYYDTEEERNNIFNMIVEELSKTQKNKQINRD